MSNVAYDPSVPNQLVDRIRETVTDMLADPLSLPDEFRAWIPQYLEVNPPMLSTSQVQGFFTVPQTACGALVYCSTAYALANNVVTAFPFNGTYGTESFDTNSFHDPTTNPSRLTVPPGKAGKYLVTGCVEYLNATVGRRAAALRLNGATSISLQEPTPGSIQTFNILLNTISSLAVGDYVELTVYQSSGGALNVDAGIGLTNLGMLLIGA